MTQTEFEAEMTDREELIESGAPFKAVLATFSDEEEPCDSCAWYFSQKYSLDRSAETCCYCEERLDLAVWKLSWQLPKKRYVEFGRVSVIPFFLSVPTVSQRHVPVPFLTHHTLCRGCSRMIRAKQFLKGGFEFICQVVQFCSLFAFMSILLPLLDDELRKHLAVWVTVAAISGLLFAASRWCLSRLKLFGVQGRFPVLSNRPFIFIGLERTA